MQRLTGSIEREVNCCHRLVEPELWINEESAPPVWRPVETFFTQDEQRAVGIQLELLARLNLINLIRRTAVRFALRQSGTAFGTVFGVPKGTLNVDGMLRTYEDLSFLNRNMIRRAGLMQKAADVTAPAAHTGQKEA